MDKDKLIVLAETVRARYQVWAETKKAVAAAREATAALEGVRDDAGNAWFDASQELERYLKAAP